MFHMLKDLNVLIMGLLGWQPSLCTRVSSVVSMRERLTLINEVVSILVLIEPVLRVASSNPVEAFRGIERCRLLPSVDLHPNLRCV